MIKKISLWAGAAMLALSFGTSVPALADKAIVGTQVAMNHGGMKHAGTILKRRTIFRCISTGLKNIKKGKGDAKKNARLVLKNAAMLSQNLKDLFPAGSDGGKSRAKKALWDDWDKFAKQADALKMASANLAKMGGSKKGLKAANKTCKGCHKPFRGKKVKGAPKVKCG